MQPPCHSRLMLLALVGATAMLAYPLTSCLRGDDDSGADPVAIHRVVLPAARILEQMQRVEQGSLVLISKKEFDAQVRAAAHAVAAAKKPPRLVEAHYHAQIDGSALVDGTAQWSIANPAGVAAIFAIPSLNLALTDARIESAPGKTTPAVLGELRRKALGLLLGPAVEQTLHLKWTARGDNQLGELHFSLQIPPCPAATLDLDLRPEQTLMPGEQYLVAGPFDSDVPDRRRWRLTFSERSVLELVVRTDVRKDQAVPALLARLRATEILDPDVLTGTFEFNVDAPQHPVHDLRLACDPGLHVLDVQATDLASWESHSASAGRPEEIHVHFGQPFRGGPLQVRCLAPLHTGRPWQPPTVRLLDALTRTETLTLRVHRDIHLDHWQSGAFRFVRPSGGDPFSALQRYQVFTLVRNDLATQQTRPRAELRLGGPELHVRQWSWWQVGVERSSLTEQLSLEMTQGRLFRLSFEIPDGWHVSDVSLPAGLRSWQSSSEGRQGVLVMDLVRPLGPGTPLRAVVRLQKTHGQPTDGSALAFPDLKPRQACFRERSLAIQVDPLYRSQLKGGEFSETPPTDLQSPWGKQAPDYYFRSRELISERQVSSNPPAMLQLWPRQARYRVRVSERVVQKQKQLWLDVEVDLKPVVGRRKSVDLYVSTPWRNDKSQARLVAVSRLVGVSASSPWSALGLAMAPRSDPIWQWRVKGQPNRIIRARPDVAMTVARTLHVLVGVDVIHHLSALAAVPQGQCWRLPLPDTGDRSLTLQSSMPLDDSARADKAWQCVVPLITSSVDPAMTGVVTIDDAVRHRYRMTSLNNEIAQPWTFTQRPARLILTETTPVHADDHRETIEAATLTTWVRPSGRLLHRFEVQVYDWRRPTLAVRLPDKAELVTVRVDGNWLRSAVAFGASNALSVPVPSSHNRHTLEILYQTNGPPVRLWNTIEAPAPRLPTLPILYRHDWQLPPALSPVATADYAGESARAEGDRPSPFDWKMPGLEPITQMMEPRFGNPAERERFFSQTALALWKGRRPTETHWRLGELLDRVVYHDAQGKATLVLDGRALTLARIGPDTVLPAAPGKSPASWQDLGLAALADHSAVLLTSRRQFEDWKAAGALQGGLSPSLETAVSDAVAHGQDAAGRFQELAEWLAQPPAVGSGLGSETPDLQLDGPWVRWQARPGAANDSLLVVREQPLSALSWILAAGLCLVAFYLGRVADRARVLFCLAWLAIAGLALLWLPVALRPLALAPACIGAAVIAIWYVRYLLVGMPRRAAVPSLLLAGIFGAGFVGHAAPLKPAIVYLLPKTPGNGASRVLAPPELLAHLRSLSRRGPQSLHRAVLLEARYEGSAVDSFADIKAEFDLFCFGAEPATLQLPLTGVELQEARLDGKAAPATVGPQVGYQMIVNGAGSHTLIVRFRAPITSSGDSRDMRFAAPPLARSRLRFTLPAAGDYVQAVGAWGAQQVESGSTSLQADLGRTATVHVRWRAPDQKVAPVLRVREGYLWELRPAGSSLIGVLQYTVIKGTTRSLSLRLPPGMEVGAVEVSRLPDSTPGDDPPPRCESWTVSGTEPVLRVQLQQPLMHGVQLTLTLYPRQPLGARPRLTVPTPMDAGLRTEPGTEPLLAYRVDNGQARLVDNLRVSRLDDESVFSDFWRREAGQPDPGSDTKAFVFQRGPGAAPSLILEVPPAPVITRSKQSVSWQLGSVRADVTATAEINADNPNLTLVQWMVGKLTVAEVSGSDVRDWRQTGDTVQIWLQQPTAHVTLALTGWLSQEKSAPGSAGNVFTLTPLYLRSTGSTATDIDVDAAYGLQLEPLSLTQLKQRPGTPTSVRRQSYRSERIDYAGVFRVRPAQLHTRVKVLTVAELRGGKVAVDAILSCRTGPDEQPITVRVWNGTASDVRFETPGLAVLPIPHPAPDESAWTVTLPASPRRPQTLHVRASVPIEPDTGVVLPVVIVQGAAQVDSSVAVIGANLHADAVSQLSRLRNPRRTLRDWPTRPPRLGRVSAAWRATAADWRLTLQPHMVLGGSNPVRLFLCDQLACMPDGRRWLHEAECLLYQERGAEIAVHLPPRARLLGAWLDGRAIHPIRTPRYDLDVGLTGQWGVHRLRLRWQFAAKDEPLDRPNLERPQFTLVRNPAMSLVVYVRGPAVWTVYLPDSLLQREEGSAHPAQAIDAVEADLSRAQAQLELSGVLAQAAPGGDARFEHALRAAQVSFSWYCRQARRRLPAASRHHRDILQLQARNERLADTEGFQRLHQSADRQTTSPAASALGTGLDLRGFPVRWTGPAEASAPRLILTARTVAQNERKAALSLLLLVSVIGIAVLSYVPDVVLWARRLWPEQLGVVGLIGWLLAPAIWPFLLLLLAALVIRVVWVGVQVYQRLAGRFGGRPTAPASSS